MILKSKSFTAKYPELQCDKFDALLQLVLVLFESNGEETLLFSTVFAVPPLLDRLFFSTGWFAASQLVGRSRANILPRLCLCRRYFTSQSCVCSSAGPDRLLRRRADGELPEGRQAAVPRGRLPAAQHQVAGGRKTVQAQRPHAHNARGALQTDSAKEFNL